MTGQKAEPATHQNIERISSTLSALARSGSEGLRLTDVARMTGMSKTAAHRNLTGLVAHGLAVLDPQASRFFLGDRILALMRMAEDRFALADRIDPYIRRLADRLSDTIYFSIRRGDDSACLGRAVGDFPIQSLTLQVGDHRPLGVGSGSLAILANLEPAEIGRIMRERAEERSTYPLTDDILAAKIDETREQGFAMMEHYLVQGIRGLVGIGVPVRNASGACVASLSVAALRQRAEGPRLTEVVESLHEESAAVEKELAELLAPLG